MTQPVLPMTRQPCVCVCLCVRMHVESVGRKGGQVRLVWL